jgi:hypothetical protein
LFELEERFSNYEKPITVHDGIDAIWAFKDAFESDERF